MVYSIYLKLQNLQNSLIAILLSLSSPQSRPLSPSMYFSSSVDLGPLCSSPLWCSWFWVCSYNSFGCSLQFLWRSTVLILLYSPSPHNCNPMKIIPLNIYLYSIISRCCAQCDLHSGCSDRNNVPPVHRRGLRAQHFQHWLHHFHVLSASSLVQDAVWIYLHW